MSVETSIEEVREKHLQPFEEVATFFFFNSNDEK
jgi:hypothetical protein